MPKPTDASFTYADLIHGQEEPELMPNEVAHHFSQLTGEDHYLAHLALIALNPQLYTDEAGNYTLSLPNTAALVAQVATMRASYKMWGAHTHVAGISLILPLPN